MRGGAAAPGTCGWWSGLLLNILQCTGKPPSQRIIESRMPTVPWARSAALFGGGTVPGREEYIISSWVDLGQDGN